jgi:predicted dehydrogenase
MDKVRIGIIGCGAIAQVQHMPNFHELQDLFDVTWTCDVSAGLAEYLANRFNVPNHTTDYHDVIAASDVDAVLLCHRDPKTEIAVASLEAGKHMFIEKPMCFSNEEADAIHAAGQKAGTVSQVGYMKVYDPAFELTYDEAQSFDPAFVQINHLHPNNNLHTRQFHIERFDDIPSSAGELSGAARNAALQQALGDDIPPEASRSFFTLSGSMIHDIYGLRTIMGNPSRVVSTEVWQEGRAISTVLEYGSGARCIATWIDLPNLWDFKETLEIYGDDKRVILAYPTGFSRGQLSQVTVQEIDDKGRTNARQPAIEWESPFVAELRHFHDCIVNGAECRTPVKDALDDIALIINMTQSYLTNAPVEFTR